MFEVQRFWAKDRNNNSGAPAAVPTAAPTTDPDLTSVTPATHTTRAGAVVPMIIEDDEEEREKSWLLMPVLSHPEGCTRCEKMFQTGDILLYYTYHNYDLFRFYVLQLQFYFCFYMYVYRE